MSPELLPVASGHWRIPGKSYPFTSASWDEERLFSCLHPVWMPGLHVCPALPCFMIGFSEWPSLVWYYYCLLSPTIVISEPSLTFCKNTLVFCFYLERNWLCLPLFEGDHKLLFHQYSDPYSCSLYSLAHNLLCVIDNCAWEPVLLLSFLHSCSWTCSWFSPGQKT